MPEPNQLTASTSSELLRRQKATATTVIGMLLAVVLLSIAAFVGKKFLTPRPNPSLDIAFRIAVLILGLGSVALRRTKFAAMRLQDIAALQGPSGLLQTLEKTTIHLALIAAVIAVLGLIATLATGYAPYTYIAGVIALAVLLYAYPIRRSWERALREFASDETPATGGG